MTFKIGDTHKMKNANQFFQGDVYVTPVDGLPDDAVECEPDARGLHVFALGESTGHVHAVQEQQNVKCFIANDNKSITGKSKFLVVTKGEGPLLFHGAPGVDKGDHAYFKMPDVKKAKEKIVFLFRRQFGKDITDPSKFTTIAD